MHHITHITLVSMGKTLALIMALMTIVYSIFFILISLAFGAYPSLELWQKLLFFAFMLLILPAINAMVGFLSGAIMAWMYNTIAKYFGGLKIELTPETTVKK